MTLTRFSRVYEPINSALMTESGYLRVLADQYHHSQCRKDCYDETAIERRVIFAKVIAMKHTHRRDPAKVRIVSVMTLRVQIYGRRKTLVKLVK